jgi:hypothetical protein
MIRAVDFLPDYPANSNGNQDFELPMSERLLLNLFGDFPDYSRQEYEDIWEEVIAAEESDMSAYCRSKGIDVTGNDGKPVGGWRDIAVMLKAIERGLLTIKNKRNEETP